MFKKKKMKKTEKMVKHIKNNPVETGLVAVVTGSVVATVINCVNNKKLKKKVELHEAKIHKFENTPASKNFEKVFDKLEELSIDIVKINHSLEEINEMIVFEDDDEESEEEVENPVIYTDEESNSFGTMVGEIINKALKDADVEIPSESKTEKSSEA